MLCFPSQIAGALPDDNTASIPGQSRPFEKESGGLRSFQAQPSRSFLYALPQLSPDLIVIPPHRRAVHLQVSGNPGLIGHTRMFPQVGGNGLLL